MSCEHYERTASGTRMLGLLMEEPEHPDVVELLRYYHDEVPDFSGFTDAQLIVEIIAVMSAIPATCLLCSAGPS